MNINPEFSHLINEDFMLILQHAFEKTMKDSGVDSKLIRIMALESNIDLDFNCKTTINHSCIWNHFINVGKEVKILTYSNKLAYVKFDDQSISDLLESPEMSNLYRLEDISQ